MNQLEKRILEIQALRGPPPPYVEIGSSTVEASTERRTEENVDGDVQAEEPLPETRKDGLRKPFIYNHTVLVTYAELKEDQACLDNLDPVNGMTGSTPLSKSVTRNQCFLHHWDPTDPKNSVAIPTKLTPENLSYVGGFRDLGAFSIPMPSTNFSDNSDCDLHEALSSSVREFWEPSSQNTEDAMLDGIVDHLTKTTTASSSIPVKFFRISIISSTENALFDGPASVWKWTKPESIYRNNSGWWESTVDEAVIDGEWSAGKNLKLLVHGLTHEEKDLVIRPGRKTSRLDFEMDQLGF